MRKEDDLTKNVKLFSVLIINWHGGISYYF
jgi:hypothetical protein